jgi:hypothetical protein
VFHFGQSIFQEGLDLAGPVLTPPPDITIECHESTAPGNTGVASATDASGLPAVSYSDTAVAGSCPYASVITRTWLAVDACGSSNSAMQVITVVDATPPVLTLPPDVTLSCAESTMPGNTGQATAIDNCSVSVSYSDITNGADCVVGITITRTWMEVDD